MLIKPSATNCFGEVGGIMRVKVRGRVEVKVKVRGRFVCHEVDAFGEPRRKRESKKFPLTPE